MFNIVNDSYKQLAASFFLEPDEYNNEACEEISSGEFYTEAVPRKGPSKGQTCPDSKKITVMIKE